MPVDINRITALVDELSLPEADKAYLVKSLTDPANEGSAQRFISQRVRHEDYTRRTQELANERATLEQRANAEVGRYAEELTAADERIRRIMKDFETEKVSRATAEARLLKVKETYNLSDDDIPQVTTPARTAAADTGGWSEERMQGMLTKFRNDLLTELKPEFRAFPRVAALMDDIDARHQELTGKRLSFKEKQDLISVSEADNGPSLERAWRDKYDIGTIEKTRERAEWTQTERKKWDDELKARNSEDAVNGVRRYNGSPSPTVSPVLNRKYNEHTDVADRFSHNPPPDRQAAPLPPGGPKPTGAERAAQKFLERRAAGIPMGEKPVPKSA